MKPTLSLLLALASLASAGNKLPSIVAKGSKFFYSNGTQFFCKGIAYQHDIGAAGHKSDPTAKYIDPLADETTCKRDVPLLSELGVNCIRTYAVDPTKDHTACMKLLEDANIYVFSDLSEPAISINRDDPTWNTKILQRYIDVIKSLGQHSNVIGFFAGNEVSNSANNTNASAYVKAAVSDTKRYIKENFDRWIGVGYAANDDAEIREEIANYFNCGERDESIDFWGHNIYSWCGESTIKESGYDKQREFFKNFNIPVFFAEYGCNQPDGAAARTWTDTTALFSDDMTDTFSGGIAYMYFQEENDYGVVEIKYGKAVKQPDFDYLKRAHAAVRPKGVDMKDYNPTGEAAKCPSVSSKWDAAPQLPPTPDKDLCKCMVEASECVDDSNIDKKSYGDLFGIVCGLNRKICAGINGNTTLGNYGAYSMCMPAEQLTYVLDTYYRSQGKSSSACGWRGTKIKTPTKSSSCQSALKTAEEHNKLVASATTGVPRAKSDGSVGGKDDSLGVRSAPSALFAAAAAIVAMLC